jgi:hypothetical protein
MRTALPCRRQQGPELKTTGCHEIRHKTTFNHLFQAKQLLPDCRGGRPESSLSLRSHGGGTPPPPGPGEGDVTTPYSWSLAGSTVGSLLRETGGFNHPRESLNPSLHTGGSRRGRSFRRRLRRWCRWHGSRSVETTSYVNVRRRL